MTVSDGSWFTSAALFVTRSQIELFLSCFHTASCFGAQTSSLLLKYLFADRHLEFGVSGVKQLQVRWTMTERRGGVTFVVFGSQ